MEEIETASYVQVEVLPPLSGEPPEVLALSSPSLTSSGLEWVNPRQLKPHPRNV
ncbi:MAG: hypothetical protein ACRDEA_06745 [Microcystaceae cyanobacterium]